MRITATTVRTTAATVLAAAALAGCSPSTPPPVTEVAPYCDATTVRHCYDVDTATYRGPRGQVYGPGATVHRGYLGLAAYTVPAAP